MYSKKYILTTTITIILNCLTALVANAAPNTLWQVPFGYLNFHELPEAVVQAPDSGYVIVGLSSSISGSNTEVFATKVDKDGITVWEQSYDAEPDFNHEGAPVGVVRTADNGFVIARHTSGTSEGIDHRGRLIKIDQDGNMVWNRYYSAQAPATGIDIVTMCGRADGGFVLGGHADDPHHIAPVGFSDAFAMGVDASGNEEWRVTFEPYPNQGDPNCGSCEPFDYINSVAQGANGSFMATGQIGGGLTGTFIVPISASGALGTVTLLDGFGVRPNLAIAATSDGGYILGGSTSTWRGVGYVSNALIIKLNASGAIQWEQVFASVGPLQGNASIEETSDGNYLLAGEEEGHFVLLKCDQFGMVVWEKRVVEPSGGLTFAQAIQNIEDGYFAVGHIYQQSNYDIFEAKLGADTVNLQHTPTNYRWGAEKVITCQVLEQLDSLSAILFYRNIAGSYQVSGMDSFALGFTDTIPISVASQDSIEYYIEVIRNGTVIARHGTSGAPNVIRPFWTLHNAQNDFRRIFDAWAFPNDLASSWPYTWQTASPDWENCTCDMQQQMCCPDSELFVYMLGYDNLFINTPGWGNGYILRPGAFGFVGLWGGCWKGACFGYAVTAAQFFSGVTLLSDSFPSEVNLGSVTANRQSLNLINAVQIYQRGFAHRSYSRAHHGDSPTLTVDSIKAMMNNASSPTNAARTLSIGGHTGPLAYSLNNHAVLPTRLEQTSSHEYTMKIYDPNYPFEDRLIFIDETADGGDGTWVDPDYIGLMEWPGPFYLSEPVSEYVAGLTAWGGSQPLGPQPNSRTDCEAASEYLILLGGPGGHTITNSSNQVVGFNNGAVQNEIPEAMPLLSYSGIPQPPLGWTLPAGVYDIVALPEGGGPILQSPSLGSAASSIVVETECNRMIATRRTSAFTDVGEHAVFNPSLSLLTVNNTFFSAATFDLSITERVEGQELQLSFSGSDLLPGEQSRIRRQDSIYYFENAGNVDVVDIFMLRALESVGEVFSASNVTVDANTRWSLIPNWDDLRDTLAVLVDHGIDETVDDTLILINEAPPFSCDSLPVAKAPAELVIQQLNPASVRLAWTRVTEDVNDDVVTIDHYALYGSTTHDFSSAELLGSTADTTFVDSSSLGTNLKYFYQVKAARCP